MSEKFWLAKNEHRELCAYSDESINLAPIKVDFLHGRFANRLRQNSGLKEPLAKAVGLRGKQSLTVIDATAGFGRDSMLLAILGCSVVMIEQSAMMVALLQDALERAQNNPFYAKIIADKRITCILGPAQQEIPRILMSQPIDVIYLDPMFPTRTKSAAVKKEMQFLHALVGNESDEANALLTIALATSVARIVVKRPMQAPILGDIKPHHSIDAGQMRFDVYLK